MDSYLPADFFIVEESPRATRGEPAFVTGLRDWSKPRGAYPRGKVPRGLRQPAPEVAHWAADSEWRPL